MSDPVIAGLKAHYVDLEVGKTYYWCSCGRSAKQPFCDGSHSETDFSPLAFTVDETRRRGLCDCKLTQNPPFCDGIHKKLRGLEGDKSKCDSCSGCDI